MRAYLWTLAAFWGVWFAALVAASIYADVSTDGNAAVAPFLVWIVGTPAAVALTVAGFLVIGCAQCVEARDRARRVS